MSCLDKRYRLNNHRDFTRIYKSSKKCHTASFISFFEPDKKLNIAFVTSKKVGIAVVRNKARRRMRALFLEHENELLNGKYIFVIKDKISDKNFSQ